MIRDLIVKLRTAADILEQLTEAVPTNKSEVRKQIIENVKLNMLDNDEMSIGKSIHAIGLTKSKFPTLKQFKKDWIITPPRQKTKGYSYKGKHWTQRPENKEKVIAMTKRAAKTRAKK